jgi:hypothetical protein
MARFTLSDQCATAAASRENLSFIFDSSVIIFQAALELIEVRTHRTHFHRLTVLFHQQPRGLHLLVLRASSANRK